MSPRGRSEGQSLASRGPAHAVGIAATVAALVWGPSLPAGGSFAVIVGAAALLVVALNLAAQALGARGRLEPRILAGLLGIPAAVLLLIALALLGCALHTSWAPCD